MQKEIASRIQQGMNPKAAIADTKHKAQKDSPSRSSIEKLPEHVVIKEFTDAADTLSLCPADCLLLLWVKPELLRVALTSSLWCGIYGFSYHGVAFVWTHGGEVQKLCLLGLRGMIHSSKVLHSRVLEVQPCGNEHYPDVFNDYILELAKSLDAV